MTVLAIVGAAALGWFLWVLYEEGILLGLVQFVVVVVGILALVIFGIKSCQETEWYQAEQAAQNAQRAANAVPRVIAEADGCKTYAFKPTNEDRWKYFVRCAGPTTTDNTYTERSGKTTRTVEDSITVETR